jgi:hypothetical protein
MPVYKILDEMPYEELVNWTKYFKARPIGWREDNRTYMLLAAQGVKEKPERLFESLASLRKARDDQPEEQRLAQSLVSSGWLAKLKDVAAKNKVSWEVEDGE